MISISAALLCASKGCIPKSSSISSCYPVTQYACLVAYGRGYITFTNTGAAGNQQVLEAVLTGLRVSAALLNPP